MNRHTATVFFLWFALTAVGEFVILGTDLFRYPVAAAEEATVVDEAFLFLTVLAVPVPAFVLSVLAYSVLRFRSRGPEQDGPPVHINRSWTVFWLSWTTGLTLFVIIFPGITGLLEIRHHGAGPVDLVVQAEGSRWVWKMTYPKEGVTSREELVLPVGKHVRFDVTATDVLHSFWVPAFRVKIDAVPGMVTTVHATPTKTGSFLEEPQFRLQCAELCGLAHNIMRVPVRVVSEEEFAAWVAAQRARQARSPQT
ncbi:MAG: cytochrome c oxidase subunit II [Chloroflexi bacterium]|nr:cytochrome c oxidase subunit II [Chloroflexota bacterium]